MGKKYRNLMGRIASTENLWLAYRKAKHGKRKTIEHLRFQEHMATHLATLSSQLSNGAYRVGAARQFRIFEPKPRTITALPFRDRVVQHALCNVIEPIFERTFLPNSCACRVGGGTHLAARKVQSMMRRMEKAGGVYFLKTDFAAYFASIDRARLHQAISAKISCRRTIALIESIVPISGSGLPIGSLTSQLFANVYGNIVDMWLAHEVGESRFVRYMDDIVILGYSPEYLHALRLRLSWFSEAELGLRFSHWQVSPSSRGVNFVGYRIWSTHKLLRRSSVSRAKRKLDGFRRSGNNDARVKFAASWLGHAMWADSYNLIKHLKSIKALQ